MTVAAFIKDPNAIEDYSITWTKHLAASETIATSTFTVPTGLTKVSESNTTTQSIVQLSGGTLHVEYLVINHVTTNQGRQFDQTVIVRIEET